jgi:hypothetical protein
MMRNNAGREGLPMLALPYVSQFARLKQHVAVFTYSHC